MPGALEIDFTKVRRKIRSVPASPKQSPKSDRKSGFTRKTKKFIAVSTPCTPLSGSRLDLRQFLRSDRSVISLSDDESEKSGKSSGQSEPKSGFRRGSEELLVSRRKICGEELLNLSSGAKVCVVLNDDELLVVSFHEFSRYFSLHR